MRNSVVIGHFHNGNLCFELQFRSNVFDDQFKCDMAVYANVAFSVVVRSSNSSFRTGYVMVFTTIRIHDSYFENLRCELSVVQFRYGTNPIASLCTMYIVKIYTIPLTDEFLYWFKLAMLSFMCAWVC